jgi:hypothetical protein
MNFSPAVNSLWCALAILFAESFGSNAQAQKSLSPQRWKHHSKMARKTN